MKQQVTNITFDTTNKIITLQLEDDSIWEGKNYSDSSSGMTFRWEKAEEEDMHTLHCSTCDL